MRKYCLLVFTCLMAFMTVAQTAGPYALADTSSTRKMYVSTARPEAQIVKQFPYNIDLKGADGTVINSAELFKDNTRPVVLMFWLTTCYPCRMELQAISSKFEAWQKEVDFKLVAISMDFPHNYGNFVKRVTESNWPFEAYNDLNREFGMAMPGALNGLPQVFVLTPQGEIVYHTRKYVTGDEDLLFSKIKEIAHP